MQKDKSEKKEYLDKENCQKDSQQENYLGGQTNSTTKNTRVDQRGIRDNEREENSEEKE